MMKKKKIKKRILLITGIIILIIWLIYKFLLVSWCNNITNVDEFFNGFNNKNYYNVSTKMLSNNEYFTYKNIRFKNYLDNTFRDKNITTTFLGEEAIQYFSKDKTAAVGIGHDYSVISLFSQEFEYFGDDAFVLSFFDIGAKGRNKILEKYSINNDIEFFELLEENANKKVSIFTPIYKIREIGTLNSFASIYCPVLDQVDVLTGDYKGYVFIINDKLRQIHVYDGDKIYYISLIGEYFTNEMYEEVLNTLIIK